MYFMYVSPLPACIPACPKMALGPITDGCEPPHGCWKLNSGPLEEQSMYLAAEPSLHFVSCHVYQKPCHSKPMCGAGVLLPLHLGLLT